MRDSCDGSRCPFNTQQDLDLHVNYLVTHVHHYTADDSLPCQSVTLTPPFSRNAQKKINPCLRLQSNNYERMNLDFDHDLYNQSHVPSDVVIRFLAETLPCLGWGKKCKEVVMDVGCGDGNITADLIMPLFPRLEKMVAFDVLPKMIEVASKLNSHPRTEYAVADIEDWSSVQQWKEQITHLLSVHCFHWLRDQRKAFQNSYRLLKSSGEAAFIFFLEASFFTACSEIQKSPKWCHFFNELDSYIPDSHHKKHNVFFYRKMLEDVGFEIIYCKERRIKDVLPSDEVYINFFTSVCVLMAHVPVDKKEEFRTDLFQEILKQNGRDSNGLPFHRGTIIELVVKKN